MSKLGKEDDKTAHQRILSSHWDEANTQSLRVCWFTTEAVLAVFLMGDGEWLVKRKW